MPAACSVMFRWQSCQSSSSILLTSSMLSFVNVALRPAFTRANVKPLSLNTRSFMNDSGDRFALQSLKGQGLVSTVVRVRG